MKKFVVFVRMFDLLSNKEFSLTLAYIVETEDILHILGEIFYLSIGQISRMSFVDYYEGIEKEYNCCEECPKTIFIPYKQKYPIGWNGFEKESK